MSSPNGITPGISKHLNSMAWKLDVKFAEWERGEITSKELEAATNLAGKLINARKVQVEYQTMRQKHPNFPEIAFLEEKPI